MHLTQLNKIVGLMEAGQDANIEGNAEGEEASEVSGESEQQ